MMPAVMRECCVYFVLAVAAVCLTLPACLLAQDESVAISRLTIPDVELVDQHGKRVRFYSDLVEGRVVAIETVFTSCTTICPMMGANFSKLSRLFTGQGRGRVNLISISVDPVTDTPEMLDRWSRQFGPAGQDWTLLTGSKDDIDRLLKALQIFTPDKLDHSPVVLIGDDGTGDWSRASALLPASRLADLLQARLKLASGRPMVRP
jgi:protein SCO1